MLLLRIFFMALLFILVSLAVVRWAKAAEPPGTPQVCKMGDKYYQCWPSPKPKALRAAAKGEKVGVLPWVTGALGGAVGFIIGRETAPSPNAVVVQQVVVQQGEPPPVTIYQEQPPKVVEVAQPPVAVTLQPWSPEWVAYCQSKFQSFNPQTGRYLTYGGQYRFCQ